VEEDSLPQRGMVSVDPYSPISSTMQQTFRLTFDKTSTNVLWIRNCSAYSEPMTSHARRVRGQPVDASAYVAVSGGRTSWSPSWKYMYDVVSKFGLRQSMRIYLENNVAKFHTDPDWNDEALGFWIGPATITSRRKTTAAAATTTTRRAATWDEFVVQKLLNTSRSSWLDCSCPITGAPRTKAGFVKSTADLA